MAPPNPAKAASAIVDFQNIEVNLPQTDLQSEGREDSFKDMRQPEIRVARRYSELPLPAPGSLRRRGAAIRTRSDGSILRRRDDGCPVERPLIDPGVSAS